MSKIDKAITIVELKKDREELIRQAQAISGAIGYVTQKIAVLEKPQEKTEKPSA